MKSTTEKYIQFNQDAYQLKRVMRSELSNLRHEKAYSVRLLLLDRLKQLLICIKHYPFQMWKSRSYVASTIQQKNTGKGRDVLLIGNGPSQGLLTQDFLKLFSEYGNDTIAINYWSDNKNLSNHIPTQMLFSDVETLNIEHNNVGKSAKSLIDYLSSNNIEVIAPFSQLNHLKGIISNKLYGISDLEFRGSNNVNILFPRGYVNMTLYKALAWAIYKGYDNIYIIGMDNTYIRTIFNDKNNHMWNLEEHAGMEDYLMDNSMFSSVSALIEDLYYCFSDLKNFKGGNIYNIDQYSLVDAFEKYDLITEFKKNEVKS